MNLNYNIHIAINKKSKTMNADVGLHRNDIFIVLHGKWSEEQLKFVICHELAHIKFKHTEQNNNIVFISCLMLVCLFLFNVVKYFYPIIFQNKYMNLTDSLFYLVFAIIYVISWNVNNIIDNKRSHQNEKDADLQAAKIVGYKLSIDALNMVNDKNIFKI